MIRAGVLAILITMAIPASQKKGKSMENPSIQSLSKDAIMLEEARQATIKRYRAYHEAKELEDRLRFQLQSDLVRYGQQESTTTDKKENKKNDSK